MKPIPVLTQMLLTRLASSFHCDQEHINRDKKIWTSN